MLSPGRESEHTYPRRAGAAAQKGGETATAQAGGEVEEQGSAAKCFRGDAVQCSAGLKNTDTIALSGLLCLFSSRFFPLDSLDGCVRPCCPSQGRYGLYHCPLVGPAGLGVSLLFRRRARFPLRHGGLSIRRRIHIYSSVNLKCELRSGKFRNFNSL